MSDRAAYVLAAAVAGAALAMLHLAGRLDRAVGDLRPVLELVG